MSKRWQSIDTAPKTGATIQAKRVYEGAAIAEGPACWRQRDPMFANVRQGMLDRSFMNLPPEGEQWCRPDGQYLFPAPTHWRPQ